MQIKKANGKKKVVISRKEWEMIGKKAGWEDAIKGVEKMTPEERASAKKDTMKRIFPPELLEDRQSPEEEMEESDRLMSELAFVNSMFRAKLFKDIDAEKKIAFMDSAKEYLEHGKDWIMGAPFSELERHFKSAKGIISTLEKVANEDRDPRVRQHASELLSRLQKKI